jgi:dTDP-4-dehydrorhamnose 3,5-epimerase
MKFHKTPIEGLVVIEPSVYSDERGSFMETYNRSLFIAAGITAEFIQDNQSVSKKGVIRGLHFQTGAFEQGKLVRVIHGGAIDVALDLRKDSPTYGKHFSLELNGRSGNLLWIPPGFAHGFESLEDDTVFHYKVTAPYNPSSEAGIRFDDPELGISWRSGSPILSRKDLLLPTLREWDNR